MKTKLTISELRRLIREAYGSSTPPVPRFFDKILSLLDISRDEVDVSPAPGSYHLVVRNKEGDERAIAGAVFKGGRYEELSAWEFRAYVAPFRFEVVQFDDVMNAGSLEDLDEVSPGLGGKIFGTAYGALSFGSD